MKKGDVLTFIGGLLSIATLVVGGLRAREDHVEMKEMIKEEVS